MAKSPHARRSAMTVTAVCALLMLLLAPSVGCTQGFGGILDRLSPVVTMPVMQGEVQMRPIWKRVVSGHNSIPSLGLSWDLKDDFGFEDSALFLDLMMRLQIGRLSFRFHSDMADFSSTERFMNQPNQAIGSARLEYSGVRLGTDIDIFMWGRSRVGVDFDYDYFPLRFTESVETLGGKRITGQEALTVGGHLLFAPGYNLYGVSPVLEIRVRRPLAGSEVSGFEISAGILGPETVVGAAGLRGGYRSTTISFTSDQLYNGVEVATDFEATIDGWFGEFVYFY